MYQDFYPNFQKEKEQLKGVLSNSVSKADLKKNPNAADWPVPSRTDVTERAYRRWLDKCVNPETHEYYLAKDERGLPIKGTEPKYLVHTIMRLRTVEDFIENNKPSEEVLLSKGSVLGHDSNGDEFSFPIQYPEMWFKTHFRYQTVYDDKRKAMVKQCQGVARVEKIYEVKFTEKNAKALLNQRMSDKIQFIVKDEYTGRAINVDPDVNLPKTFDRSLKPFDYLFNANYISPQQKVDYHRRAVQEGLIQGSGSDVSNAPPGPPPKGAYS